jgi:biotin carboxyl carrier protein
MKWEVSVNNRIVEVDPSQLPSIEEVEPGVYSVLDQGRSYQVRIVKASNGWSVEAGGKTLAVEVRDPRDASNRSRKVLGPGRQNIAAPMPGKVVRVLVKEGDAVEAGQGLVVVEAMKMQNAMKAVSAGAVVRIRVRDGDTVAAGDVMVTIE